MISFRKFYSQKQPSRSALRKRCSKKYAANLQENTHAEVRFIEICNFTEIVLRHGCSPVICCIFTEHLFLRASLDGCFCTLPTFFTQYVGIDMVRVRPKILVPFFHVLLNIFLMVLNGKTKSSIIFFKTSIDQLG